MFPWFKSWLQAWGKPQPMGDVVIKRTIDQVKTCRGHLTMLMEEARLARQMLDTVESEISEERRRNTKRVAKQPKTFTAEERQRT